MATRLQQDLALATLVTQINRARENPKEVAEELEQEVLVAIDDKMVYRPARRHVAIQTNEGKDAVNEAIKVLREASPVGPIACESGVGLSRAAGDSVDDLCASGATSGGRAFTDRVTSYGSYKGTAREVKMFGEKDMEATDVLHRMLIDDGNAKRSKRTLALDPKMKILGAQSGAHGDDGAVVVMIFAEEYTDNENAAKEGPPVKEPLPELTAEQVERAMADAPTDMSLQSLVAEINRARTDPKLAADYLAHRLQYYKGDQYHPPGQQGDKPAPATLTHEGVAAVKDAIQHLQQMEALKPMKAESGRGLSFAAADKVVELAESRSTVGPKNFGERMARYGAHEGAAQELTFYYDKNIVGAREIVARFLIDDGNKKRSHREIVLNPDMKTVGAYTAPHPTNGNCLVLIVTEGFEDDKEKVEQRQSTGKPVEATGA